MKSLYMKNMFTLLKTLLISYNYSISKIGANGLSPTGELKPLFLLSL